MKPKKDYLTLTFTKKLPKNATSFVFDKFRMPSNFNIKGLSPNLIHDDTTMFNDHIINYQIFEDNKLIYDQSIHPEDAPLPEIGRGELKVKFKLNKIEIEEGDVYCIIAMVGKLRNQ